MNSNYTVLFRKIWDWQQYEPSTRMIKWFRIDVVEVNDSERAILLKGCGLEFQVISYVIIRRVSIIVLNGLLILLVLALASGAALFSLSTVLSLIIIGALLACMYWDIYFLKMFRELRAVTITKELYAISHQLLYFQDSALHLHSKLRRCLPYSKLLRRDMEVLLAEWYQDPALALQRFKQRLGTAEGISFVEILDALRLQHHDSFYEMLRTHIRDYKERIDLAKESRKETSSYLLFVIAGVPILFTFQVFLYPWVQEVNKLLSLLN